MNDPLKKYIQENRDDFDHLEPSMEILLKLKGQLNTTRKERKGIIRLITNHKWMVAASVFILVSITYILITNTGKIAQQQFAKNDLPEISKKQTLSQNKKDFELKEANEISNVKTPKKKREKQAIIDMLPIYHDLIDSTSASTRLAAILNIQKSTIISYDIIERLAQTLNHDSNSNVRLAALNLMSKYAQDGYVNNVFMMSLSHQSDPLLQLNLIQLLSQTDNPKLDDKLYALANDPTTFAQVKDQAYLVLLNQNKL